MKKIFITGGAGYVGSELTKHLLNIGYQVTVYDLFIYGNTLVNDKNLKLIKGDIRNQELLRQYLQNHDALIHLACISNDPSFELNPKLGKEINLDAFEPLVKLSKMAKIKKFFYASSSSVYGIKSEKNVNEDMSLEPLTDYSKFKAECEKILLKYKSDDFITTIIRPATVCGFSSRQRLDLVVNILTNLAYHKKEISVFGGDQLRPNIHIKDMVRSYSFLLEQNEEKINGEIFNIGYENKSINQLATEVKSVIGDDVRIVKVKSNDNRSYHISSSKIHDLLGFKNNFTIIDAIKDLKMAFETKKIVNSFDDINFFNIKKMQNIKLK